MACFSLRRGVAELEMVCFLLRREAAETAPDGIEMACFSSGRVVEMVLSAETEILKLIEIEMKFGTELYSEANFVLPPSDSGQLESSRKY